MTLLDRLRQSLGAEPTVELRYHCRDCGADFMSAETSRSVVECPDCHASGPRSISKL